MTASTRHSVAVILTGIVALSATACGSTPAAAPTTSKSTKPAAHSTIPAGDNGKLVHPVGAISDLSKFACKADGSGSWSANGVITNATKKTQQFILDITVINKADTVVGSVRRQFPVAAGHRVNAHASDFYRSKAPGLRCLPRLVSGSK